MGLLDKRKKQRNELEEKRGQRYGAEEKGVHSPSYSNGADKGQSIAGDLVRATKIGSRGADNMRMAKQEHSSALSDLKEAPGPTSGKSGFAKGGDVDCPECCDGMPCELHGEQDAMHEMDMVSKVMGKRKEMMMADGGAVDSMDRFMSRQANKPKIKGVHEAIMKGDPGTSVAGSNVYGHGYGNNMDSAKRQHAEKLEELKKMPAPKLMSMGGKVANEDEPEADFMPNEFDYLETEGGMQDNSGAGNEHGDPENDSRLQDMVSRVMLKRKKQHNPRPA